MKNGNGNGESTATKGFKDPFNSNKRSSFNNNNNNNNSSSSRSSASTFSAMNGNGGGQSSSSYLVYLLLLSVSCIVLIPYTGKLSGGIAGFMFRRGGRGGEDEDDGRRANPSSNTIASSSSSNNYYYKQQQQQEQQQYRGISRNRGKFSPSLLRSDESFHGFPPPPSAAVYEAKCESLELLLVDTQRVVHGERERTLFLENELRVLQISESFLKGRVEYLETMSRRRDLGIISRPPSPSPSSASSSSSPFSSSMDPSSASSSASSASFPSMDSSPPPPPAYNLFRNPSASSPPSPSPSPSPSSSPRSDSTAIIQDLLRMVLAERDRTSALEAEMRLLQSSESLMQARIQRLEERLGSCKAP